METNKCSVDAMRPPLTIALKKLFVIISLVTLCFFVVFSTKDYEYTQTIEAVPKVSAKVSKKPEMKYILLWAPEKCDDCAPFDSLGVGQYPFRRLHCPFQNCYLTRNKSLIKDYTKFDAIMFNGRPASRPTLIRLPERRSEHQLYVFLQLESADRFPVCHPVFDGFFNRTFTYRLVGSDYEWPYFKVVSSNGEVVGPKEKVDWKTDMLPVEEDFRQKLGGKKKIAAWFVSNCRSRNKREEFVDKLQLELQRHNHTIDIYGNCGPLKCPREKSNECAQRVQRDYFFYLSLENSFSEDYVTEKLLTPLLNGAVPVVFGAANYNRFLPPGSYLNGRQLGPANLAATMLDIMHNATRYADMFRWRRHYSYVASWPAPMCQICEDLNLNSQAKSYSKFREWWFPNYKKRCPVQRDKRNADMMRSFY